MLLELSDEEARELRIALETHLHGLRTEFASTETRRFKARLLETLNLLEGVAARLDQGEGRGTTAHP